MFHLDYLSCFFTILATILLARKSWIGLLVAIVNSLIRAKSLVIPIGIVRLEKGCSLYRSYELIIPEASATRSDFRRTPCVLT